MKKVSIIIPTYNRYQFLLKAVNSVKQQTYKNIEIIIVNDGSTQSEYNNKINDVIWIDLPQNSKIIYGFPCVAHVINQGLKKCTGDYICILNDDDCWLPHKLSTQIEKLEQTDMKMCTTQAYTGKGLYDENKIYEKYLKFNNIPKRLTLNVINQVNLIITSSTIIHKDIVNIVGDIPLIALYGTQNNMYEDYEYWKLCMKHTDCLYLSEPLIYYDMGHGHGQNK